MAGFTSGQIQPPTFSTWLSANIPISHLQLWFFQKTVNVFSAVLVDNTNFPPWSPNDVTITSCHKKLIVYCLSCILQQVVNCHNIDSSNVHLISIFKERIIRLIAVG